MFKRSLKIFLPVAFGVALTTYPVQALGVSSSSQTTESVVIAQVQAGSASGEGAAAQEFISLYNNSLKAVDVSNWCLSNKAGNSFACLTPPDAKTTLSLPSHAYALVASDSFKARFPGVYDIIFPVMNKTSGSLVGGSDTLSLLDGNGTSIDTIGWTVSLAGGTALVRQWGNQSAGQLVDTDTATDFKKVGPLVIPLSGVIEEVHVVDMCRRSMGSRRPFRAAMSNYLMRRASSMFARISAASR